MRAAPACPRNATGDVQRELVEDFPRFEGSGGVELEQAANERGTRCALRRQMQEGGRKRTQLARRHGQGIPLGLLPFGLRLVHLLWVACEPRDG